MRRIVRDEDEHTDRARYARLPGNEEAPFQGLDHLVDGRTRYEKVLLNVQLSWWSTEAKDLLRYETEVFALALGRLKTASSARGRRMPYSDTRGKTSFL